MAPDKLLNFQLSHRETSSQTLKAKAPKLTTVGAAYDAEAQSCSLNQSDYRLLALGVELM